jgi:hypothetical protein
MVVSHTEHLDFWTHQQDALLFQVCFFKSLLHLAGWQPRIFFFFLGEVGVGSVAALSFLLCINDCSSNGIVFHSLSGTE